MKIKTSIFLIEDPFGIVAKKYAYERDPKRKRIKVITLIIQGYIRQWLARSKQPASLPEAKLRESKSLLKLQESLRLFKQAA